MLSLLQIQLFANPDSTWHQTPYHINLSKEIPLLSLGTIPVAIGTFTLPKRARLTEQEATALRKEKVNRFDRKVFKYQAEDYNAARFKSDIIQYSTAGLPILLLLDKKIRKHWLEIGTLYYESQLINGGFLVGTSFIYRPRPYAYNTSLLMSDRLCYESSNSFYSGHTSTTAISTFFMAKVYSDYHHLNFWKKTMLYTAAAIPPLLAAHYRIMGGKHFRTDVMTGFAVGAAMGILIPELHKRKRNDSLTYIPFYNQGNLGMRLCLRF